MCTKFQVATFKTNWVLPFWMPNKATIYAIYEGFGIFPIFYFERLGHSESALRSFYAFLTKIWPKNMHHTTQTQNYKFDLFDLLALDDLD